MECSLTSLAGILTFSEFVCERVSVKCSTNQKQTDNHCTLSQRAYTLVEKQRRQLATRRRDVPVDGARERSAATVSLFSCSADGNYEVTLMTKATVYYSGIVVWQPPAIYKSSCAIDVEFFPYDIQTCVLKLGSWTYDGFKVRGVFFKRSPVRAN